MDGSNILAHINQRFGTAYELVGRYATGESGIASKVIDAAYMSTCVLRTRFCARSNEGEIQI